MKEKIKQILKLLGSYKMLFILWLVLGIVTIITGNISRITYACPWALLLIEYLAKALDGK